MVKIEHIDDLPLLAARLKEMGVPELINKHFPTRQGWRGVSPGKVITGWLLYILSEADHRLSHVEAWAAQRLSVLSAILEEPQLNVLDFSDDKLGRLLDRLSVEAPWQAFEADLSKHLLQVYTLSGPFR